MASRRNLVVATTALATVIGCGGGPAAAASPAPHEVPNHTVVPLAYEWDEETFGSLRELIEKLRKQLSSVAVSSSPTGDTTGTPSSDFPAGGTGSGQGSSGGTPYATPNNGTSTPGTDTASPAVGTPPPTGDAPKSGGGLSNTPEADTPTVGTPTNSGLGTSTGPVSGGPAPGVIWAAGMETGDQSEWSAGARGAYSGGASNTGSCTSEVTSEVAHSGRYSLKLTIDTSNGKAACRQNRYRESQTGQTLVYSAWYYLPSRHVPKRKHWNVWQLKTQSNSASYSGSPPFWTINILPRAKDGPLHLVLKWKGGDSNDDPAAEVSGPRATDGPGMKVYDQSVADVPIGRWFQIEAYLKQSGQFDGQLTVWQDGVKLWDFINVRTKYPDGDQRWLLSNYSNGLSPSSATIYIDDVHIRTP